MAGIKVPFSTNTKTKDKYFIVSKSDYVIVNRFNWYLDRSGNGHLMVTRNATKHEKLNGSTNKIKLHRFLLNAKGKHNIVDHINRNPLDNRRCNLRICTHRENMNNRKDNVV